MQHLTLARSQYCCTAQVGTGEGWARNGTESGVLLLKGLGLHFIALILALLPGISSQAVEPDEILQDPVLEERAREISNLLRCLVCQNETIDGSNAPLARDLRLLVRDLLKDGNSDSEVIDHIVDRYGSFVLFRPESEGFNLVLYLFGPCLLFIALLTAFHYLRSQDRLSLVEPDELDEEESAAIRLLAESADETDYDRRPVLPNPDAPGRNNG